jgi:hypothetical protein
MEILQKLWRHGENVSFWTLVLLHLVPVWAFRYLPTQDGPSHLANAQIIKDYGASAAGYEAYFEVRADPVPNWTSHLLLAGLLYVVPPLYAEKLLVSLYIVGFAGTFRYFLGAFGRRCRALSWLGLLFVYNRCFWMGFYNYCLGLILVWLIVGYCVRRRGELRWPQAVVLTLLFPLAYFTHLVSFALALIGALGASMLVKPRCLLGPLVIGVSAAPSCLLTLDYFEQTRFFEQGAARRLVRQPLVLLQGGKMERSVTDQLAEINQEVFEHHAGTRVPLRLFIAFFIVYAGFGIGEYCYRVWLEPPLEVTEVALPEPSGDGAPAPRLRAGLSAGRLFPFLLGLLFLAFYLLLADHLGSGSGLLPHGGFLKARLALLPPLVLLACLREPAHMPTRLLLRLLAAVLLGVNLFLVTRTMDVWNKALEQYTAGIPAVGRGQRLLSIGADGGGRLVNPMLHAADYYCLGTDNLNLDNYEASTAHFPVKFRPGVPRGRTQDADILIHWRNGNGAGLPGWEEIFTQGPLSIYRRQKGQAPRTDR